MEFGIPLFYLWFIVFTECDSEQNIKKMKAKSQIGSNYPLK